MTRHELEVALDTRGLQGRAWGRQGNQALEELENELGSLPLDLRSFAQDIGNFLVDPFSVIVTGDEEGRMNAATETRALANSPGIKIMDHAGESYFVLPSGEVEAYDSVYIAPGQATLRFPNLDSFLHWLLTRAQEFQTSSNEFTW